MGHRTRARTAAFAAVLVAFLPAAAPAQEDGPLAAAEVAADTGDLERARDYLRRWLGSPEAMRPDADRSRALLLRARLSANLDSAEADYVEAAVRGGERHGALARLRLAQLRLARGRPGDAAADLARLRADFPDSGLVGESWLWSGHALEAAGDPAAACDAWRRAASIAAGSPGRDAAEAASRCATGGDAASTGSFTVQLGAFGSPEAAEQLRSRAASSDFEVRVTGPDASTPLHRVRVGRFARKDDAARLAVRLRSEGFEAIVVSEAQ
ncbi:MAG: SPOR domain-containing protein [Gemmatimonadota bacterium]